MQLTIPRPQSLPALPLVPQPVLTLRDRDRRSSGSEDRALYACGCGYAFRASVTTSVGCPQCGQTQDW